MSKGLPLGPLPGVMQAQHQPAARPLQAAQPHASFTQHGNQKGAPFPVVPHRPRLFPPRTCRLLGPDNGRGLSKDRALLLSILRAAGWEVTVLERSPLAPGSVALQVHLEVPAPHLFSRAQHNVILPNPEWWRPEWAPMLSHPGVRIWAKTADSERLFRDLRAPVTRIGWQSADRKDETVPRRRAFLHVGGRSPHKGTERLLAAWQPGWPPLTVIGAEAAAQPPPNVTVRGHVPDDELQRLQNEHAFHVYPGRYEGYGHAQWEGLSCGAVVFCTDGPPFDEHPGAFRLLPSTPGARAGLATCHDVLPSALLDAVAWALGLSEDALTARRQQARRAWEAAAAAFQGQITAALCEVSPRPLVTLQSPHERCGIAEYGRQLDEALSAGGLVPLALPITAPPDQLLSALGRGTTLLVHFEPGLVSGSTAELLREARGRGARIVFCCHLFEPAILSAWGSLVDRFVVHRPYAGVASDKLVEIPLGCPEYTPPAEDRAALRARLGLPADRLVATTLGFLVRWKRLPETLTALLEQLPPSVFLQVLTPPPFRGSAEDEIARVYAVLARHKAHDRVLFSTDFRPAQELLDRVHASDLGFLYHGEDTGSVSAATKSFVSARTPLVATGSSHAADLREGVLRVGSFQHKAFAVEVARVAEDPALRKDLRAGMAREYERLRMTAVARQYAQLLSRLSA